MIISKKWLKEKSACSEGIEWFENQEEIDGIKVVEKLIKEDQLRWANWLIVRIMDYKQYVSYAVFAAEQVICIFEKKYPDDKRPREAIGTAKKCIKDPSQENKKAAYAAANGAAYAANAAYAAAYAAYAAAYAAYAAAYAANGAAYAAAANDAAAYAAANGAAYAAAANAAMRKKILEHGIKLLKR